MSPASAAAFSTSIPPPTRLWNARARPERSPANRRSKLSAIGVSNFSLNSSPAISGQWDDRRVQEPPVRFPLGGPVAALSEQRVGDATGRRHLAARELGLRDEPGRRIGAEAPRLVLAGDGPAGLGIFPTAGHLRLNERDLPGQLPDVGFHGLDGGILPVLRDRHEGEPRGPPASSANAATVSADSFPASTADWSGPTPRHG